MKQKSSKSIWSHISHGYHAFAHDEPGERFLNFYQRWNRPGQSVWVSVAFLAAGAVLIVLGVLLGLVPGVPGVVLMLLGVALISTRFRWMAVGLDWTELKCRKLVHRIRREQRPVHRALKSAPPLPP